MKRHLLFILSIGLLLLLTACGRGGPEGEYLTTYIEVPAGTAALDATLSFDAEALEFLGAASAQEGVMVEANAQAARLKLAAVTVAPQGKRLALVSFKIKQGTAEPTLQSAQAYSVEGAPLAGVTLRSERGEENLAEGYSSAALTTQAIVVEDLTLEASFAERLLGDVIPDADDNVANDINSLDALGILQLATGGVADPSDLQKYLADLDTSRAVNSIDAQIALLKATNNSLEATLRATPDALELDVGETGLILAGNAGNQPLSITLPQVAGVSITQVGGIDGQTAAYEVTPESSAQSGLITLSAGNAGQKIITLIVSEPADIPSITLTTPTEGAVISGESVDVFWEITLKESDDHVHVYVDGEKKEGSVDYKNPYTLDFADKNIEPGQHVLEVRVSDKDHNEYTNPAASDSINFTLQAAPTVGDVLYRVNVGGPELTAGDNGPDWGADTGQFGDAGNSPYLTANSTGGSTYSGNSGSAHSGAINTSDASIPAGTPAAMFNTERYDTSAAPEMQWEFPVAAGTIVEVRLYFAELFNGVDAAGERVFDVEVEGAVPTAFDDVDPFAIAGAKGAFVRSHTLTVTDGTLDIDFIHGVENPAIKGIEIVASDGSTGNTPPQLGALPDRTDAEDTMPDLAIPATDVDGDNLTYSATGLPSGLSVVDTTNGHIGGTIAQGAAADSPYTVTVSVTDGAATVQKSFAWTVTPPSSAAALIKVNSGGGLFASTFTGGAFQIENTGDVAISSVAFNLSTALLPDVVFDPTGTAGDSGAKCLTPNSGASAVGFVAPTNPCTDPFSQPHNGSSSADGFDSLSASFTDFGAGEMFTFSVDIDPTSIKNDTSTGDAGSISGLELIGSTVTVSFADGTTLSTTLWDEGSLGGSQAVVAASPPASLTLSVDGVSVPATVASANQTLLLNGPANANVSVLRVDARLYIDAGGGGYDIDPFEANEVLAKELYSGTLSGSGTLSLPVTLTQTASPNAGPDAGLNHFIAVVEGSDGQTSATSNVVVLELDPDGDPAALVQVNAGAGLFTSTFNNSSFQITNTGDSDIQRVTIDASTSFLPDVVFDPVGKAGDSGAKCLTLNGGSDGGTGLSTPSSGSNACTVPFSQPHNGANDEEGYDVLTLEFTDFNPGETLSFGVDMDPTSIKGDQSTGDAGSISGFEIIGATVTVEFVGGEVTSSLWDEGSLGGSQAVVKPGAPTTLSINVANVSLDNGKAAVSDAAQTLTLSGPANATVTLLRADARLYIDSGAPGGGVGYDIDAFEANEVLAKELYTTTLNSGGDGNINVTLSQTSSPNAGPDAGLNHFIAVVTGSGEQTSLTSNVIVLDYTPDGGNGGGTTGAFIEQNGLVVIEMESGDAPSNWQEETSFGGTGGSYLRYDGNNHFNNPGIDTIEYQVDITQTGTYRFQWRNAFGAGNDPTEHNDAWLKIEADSFYGKQGSSIVCPKGYNANENSCTSSAPNGAGSNGWFKVYRSGGSLGAWSWTANTSDDDAHQIFADFDAPGTYTILVSGRSAEHAIDRMVLYHSSVGTGTATNTSQPESPRTN